MKTSARVEDAVQQRGVVRVLDVGDEALLAAVEPDEIAGQALRRPVVAAREVALGRSILMTRAPASARRELQYGAATACSSETTSRPSRGLCMTTTSPLPATCRSHLAHAPSSGDIDVVFRTAAAGSGGTTRLPRTVCEGTFKSSWPFGLIPEEGCERDPEICRPRRTMTNGCLWRLQARMAPMAADNPDKLACRAAGG